MKQQIVVMHGGHVAASREEVLSYLQHKTAKIEDFQHKKGWKDHLQTILGDRYEFFYPKMPNKDDSKYAEWKVWFEKLIPFLSDDVILVGHSLGGLFFMKYLSENAFPKKIKAFFSIAAPNEGRNKKHILQTFNLKENISDVARQAGKVFIYHSKEDPVVPFDDFLRYKELLPSATFTEFSDRGHFNTVEFPELVEDIKKLG